MPSARRARSEPALDFLRLMWAVDHELQSVSKRMLAELGQTGPQRLAIRLIGLNPGLAAGELAGLCAARSRQRPIVTCARPAASSSCWRSSSAPRRRASRLSLRNRKADPQDPPHQGAAFT